MSVSAKANPRRRTTRTTGGRFAPKPETPPAPDAPTNHQEQLLEDQDLPRFFQGKRIVETERPQNLPKAPFNVLKHRLEDDSTVWSCVDCPEVMGTRDEVRRHRSYKHSIGKRVNNKVPDVVLSMTIGDVLKAAESSTAVGGHLERVETERDELRRQLQLVTNRYNKLVRTLEKAGFHMSVEDDE